MGQTQCTSHHMGQTQCTTTLLSYKFYLPGFPKVYDGVFFPRGVLGEILNLIESVSEGFPSYFFIEQVSAECRVQEGQFCFSSFF